MAMGKDREEERYLERTRLIMWEIRTKYVKRGVKIKPEDIFKLSSDKKEIKLITKEEMQRLKKITQN